MEDNPKNLPPEPRDDDSEEFVDEVTRNRIDRHLHDINDTISEQDIKNIVTDISSPDIDGHEKNEEEPLPDEKRTGIVMIAIIRCLLPGMFWSNLLQLLTY